MNVQESTLTQSEANRDLINTISEEIPNYKQVSREEESEAWFEDDDPWWQELYVQLFVWLATYMKGLKRYAQGVFHLFLYQSDDYKTQKIRDDSQGWYALVCHEFQHQMDQWRHPFLFVLTYLLPPVWNPVRALVWELKAYVMQEWYYYVTTGEHLFEPEYVADQLCGPFYLYAAKGFHGRIVNVMKYAQDEMEQGTMMLTEKGRAIMKRNPFYMSTCAYLAHILYEGYNYEREQEG